MKRQRSMYVRVVYWTGLAVLALIMIGARLSDNLQNVNLVDYLFNRAYANSGMLDVPCNPQTHQSVALMKAKLFTLLSDQARAENCIQSYLNQGGLSPLATVLAAQFAATRGDWAHAAGFATWDSQASPVPLRQLSQVYRAAQTRNFQDALIAFQQSALQFRAIPLFESSFQQISARLQIGRLQFQANSTPVSQLALATEHWRLGQWDQAQRLIQPLLAADGQLKPRLSAWAWYLLGDMSGQQGKPVEALEAYQSGLAADPTFIANVWNAVALLANQPVHPEPLYSSLFTHLETIEPEGLVNSDVPSDLLGFTIVPEDDLVPDGRYEVYLFWRLGTASANQSSVIQTQRWAIQQLSLSNQVPYGHFNPTDVSDGIIRGWERMIFSGEASILEAPDASGGVLRLAPARGSDRVVIRNSPPEFGLPIHSSSWYLLTARARVGHDGVITLGCTWFEQTTATEHDSQGSRSYLETYSAQWQNIGILLLSPDRASGCELRVGYLFGVEGWINDIRLFELPDMRATP